MLAEQKATSLVSSISEQGAVSVLNTHCVSLAVVGIIENMTKECQSLGGIARTIGRREQERVISPLNTFSKSCTFSIILKGNLS